MRVVDTDGRDLTSYDLAQGELHEATVIRDNAVPIDGVTKVAWDDEDYETVMMYTPFPAKTGADVTAAMREACAAAITGGVDVTLGDGQTCHFSLTIEDQMNLISLQSMVDAGAEAVPYHADGEECRYYSAEDFHTITQAATMWKLYQESYFNSLRGYIQSLESEDELEAVQYGMEIPEAFQTDVLRQLMGGMET